MLSSHKISRSSWRYYVDRAACRPLEYYLGVGEAPGRWHGRGLEPLGLERGAAVTEQQLEAMFARGIHPDNGDRLGRAWRTDGVTGYDLTFSTPKSVSALWALGSEEVAAASMAAHRAAVKAGLAYLDTHAAWSRRGTDGVEQVATEGLTVALFDHRTSRELDPQLHTHALVLNKVQCVDGTWRTLDGKEMFDHKKSAGMIYHAALRNEMRQRLGVEIEPVSKDGQADVRGVPAELLGLWSKRSRAIDAEAGPKIAEYEKLLGRSLTAAERARVIKTAVLKTRPGKSHEPTSVLHATWATEAATVGWTPKRLQHAARVVVRDPARPDWGTDRPLPTDPATLARRLEEVLPGPGPAGQKGAVAPERDEQLALAALQAAGVRAAVFSRAEVAGQVAAHLPTDGLTAAQVLVRVEELTDAALRLAEAIPVGQPIRGVTPRRSDPRYATVQVLQAEAQILSLAERGRGVGYGKVDHRVLWPALEATDGRDRLDSGQYRAVLHLAGDGDFLTVLTAPAGAGKTSTLGAASRAWTQAGYRVVGLAPSARAAAELAAATGTRTDTLAKWLHNHDHLAQLPEQERAWTRLDDRTILIVDEASMASTLDLDRLTAAAGRAAAKVVLVGDPGQIGVINGPGGMLAALAHAGHGTELEQIHRFRDEWEREASLALRKGDTAVLGVYRSQDRLHPCPTGDQALDALFNHWTHARHDGQDPLMLARTRLDVDALNTRARNAALADGQITGPVTRAGERDWQAGDLLRTRRNNRHLTLDHTLGHARGQDNGQDPSLPGQGSGPGNGQGSAHVRNGDRFRVLGPGPNSGLIVEDLAGRGRTVLPADYLAEHCEYGWALTIDAAQGATADVGLVLVRPGIDREHLYVGMTRGRNGNHAYITPDPTVDPEHDHGHSPAARKHTDQDPHREANGVLTAALAQSGAQDAAHTALAEARKVAADTARKTQERQAAEAERQRLLPQPVPVEHTRAVEQLQALRAERDRLHHQQLRLWASARDTKQQLDAAPKWARGRRQTLTATFAEVQGELRQTHPALASLDTKVQEQTRLVDSHTRQRDDERRDQQRRSGLAAFRRMARNDLALPRPTQDQVRDLATRLAASRSRDADDFYVHSHDNDRGLSR